MAFKAIEQFAANISTDLFNCLWRKAVAKVVLIPTTNGGQAEQPSSARRRPPTLDSYEYC